MQRTHPERKAPPSDKAGRGGGVGRESERKCPGMQGFIPLLFQRPANVEVVGHDRLRQAGQAASRLADFRHQFRREGGEARRQTISQTSRRRKIMGDALHPVKELVGPQGVITENLAIPPPLLPHFPQALSLRFRLAVEIGKVLMGNRFPIGTGECPDCVLCGNILVRLLFHVLTKNPSAMR